MEGRRDGGTEGPTGSVRAHLDLRYCGGSPLRRGIAGQLRCTTQLTEWVPIFYGRLQQVRLARGTVWEVRPRNGGRLRMRCGRPRFGEWPARACCQNAAGDFAFKVIR